jgi:hypothetical protein
MRVQFLEKARTVLFAASRLALQPIQPLFPIDRRSLPHGKKAGKISSLAVPRTKMYSRILFIQETKHWKHPNNRIALKLFFMFIHFLYHAIVISEE